MDRHGLGKQALVAVLFIALSVAVAVPTWLAARAKEQATTTAGPTRDSALIIAAGHGDTEEVRRLLRQGASVRAADERGRTALLAAAYGDHPETMRVLLAAGSDI